jgi:hypothetical protein
MRSQQPPPVAIPMPSHRISHINVDIVGPLPPSGGFTLLLTVVDRYSRWPRQESRKTDTGAGDAHLMCSWLSGGLPDMKKEMAVDEKFLSINRWKV